MSQAEMDITIEGHAIISADAMIADAVGDMPDGLHNEADWHRFQRALDASALVILGRLGHGRHPNSGRRRLVATSGIDGVAPDPHDPHAMLWNPAGITFDSVLDKLGIAGGRIAVTGGTRVFDLFIGSYDSFHLAVATRARIPGGRPCFSSGSPEEILARSGLVPDPSETLDAAAGVVLTEWKRR